MRKTVTVAVDRPLGSHHPEYPDLYYPVNYGYIKGTVSPDGEEQDVYILGVDEPLKEFVGEIIAKIHRDDDIEEKWVAAPHGLTLTKDEIEKQTYFQEKYFKSTVILL